MKTDSYSLQEVAQVVQLRANVEGLKLGSGVLDRLASEGERSSLRYVLMSYIYAWLAPDLLLDMLSNC